jgi:hypothetical protein
MIQLTVAVLLLAFGTFVLANFNVQTAHAGGSPQPLYQLFSTKITADANFTINTLAPARTYLVHSHDTGSDYNVAMLGTDYICIHKAGTAASSMLCLPYSAIADVNF